MSPRWLLVLLATAVASVVSTPASADDEDGRITRLFRIASPEITESSSLVVSTVSPDLAYTTNDSGDAATVYVLDTTDGTLVGRTRLADVDAVDIEALAGGSDGMLVVADVGDNDAARESVDVVVLPQPGRGDTVTTARTVELTYSDGPRDAESALYDARTGRIYVVSKEFVAATIYVSPPDVFDRPRGVLRPVARAPGLATDATLLPGGEYAVVRTYAGATIYRFPSFEPVDRFRLPRQAQGESIAAPASGDVVWVGSEGDRSPVVSVPLPRLSKPAPSRSTPTSSAEQPGMPAGSQETARSDSGDRGAAHVLLVAAGSGLGLLLVVGTVGLLRSRRLS